MADILLQRGDNIVSSKKEDEPKVHPLNIPLSGIWHCTIHGKEDTYSIYRQGQDFIIAIGYVSFLDSSSLQESLAQIYETFHESQIGDLKKGLIGEYILLIKKGNRVFVFSDFFGLRNIFASSAGGVVSSSYSLVEDQLGTGQDSLNTYKFFEYLAMGHLAYPCWLGHSTYHKLIQWLRSNEYLAFSIDEQIFQIHQINFSIDNNKLLGLAELSDRLLTTLRKIAVRKEHRAKLVASTLTGGRDSRIISALALTAYPNLRFRVAVSPKIYTTQRDLRISKRIAKKLAYPLDIFWYDPGLHEASFFVQTEGFSPVFNNNMAPLIDAAGAYSLGLGGLMGTELFSPIRFKSIDTFIQAGIKAARRALDVEDSFWPVFRKSIYDEFLLIKSRYQLQDPDERDLIRLFILAATGRNSSFIMSAYNLLGYQLDPYAHFPILEIALQIPPVFWGGGSKLMGTSLIQKEVMAKLNVKMARPIAIGDYRPMIPLSLRTFSSYLRGYAKQIIERLAFTLGTRNRSLSQRTKLPFNGYYSSDGWEYQFLSRTVQRYGLESQHRPSA